MLIPVDVTQDKLLRGKMINRFKHKLNKLYMPNMANYYITNLTTDYVYLLKQLSNLFIYQPLWAYPQFLGCYPSSQHAKLFLRFLSSDSHLLFCSVTFLLFLFSKIQKKISGKSDYLHSHYKVPFTMILCPLNSLDLLLFLFLYVMLLFHANI